MCNRENAELKEKNCDGRKKNEIKKKYTKMKGSVVFWCTVYDTLYVCEGKIDVIAVYDGRQYSVVELCAINCCYISNISSILSFFFPILFNKYSTLILKRATLRR